MIEAFNLGPFLIPTRPLLLLLCLVIAIWSAGHLGIKFGLDKARIKRAAENTAWIGILGARLGFVAVNWSAYRSAPWTTLYVWQPGYLYLGALISGSAYVLWQGLVYSPGKQRLFITVLASSYLLAGTLYFTAIGSLELLRQPDVPGSGNLAPDIRFKDLSGTPVRLSDLKGRGIVLNFWATWCPPCRREMPMLDEFHANYRSKGLSVIGLAIDEPPGQVRRFVESIGVSYPIWVDAPRSQQEFDRSQEVFAHYGGVGLPMTIFIDRKGIIRRIYVGELSRGFLHSQADTILAW
jgi:thiol-disulfide isomerase/thioredoxin